MGKSKISIIGAGPIGAYSGMLLARKGYEVNIYEEHDSPGIPVQCTGIVSRNLAEFFDINELKRSNIILNTIHGARIFSPDGKSMLVKSRKEQAYILDRTAFDRYIIKESKKAGAHLHLNCQYIDNKDGFMIINDKKGRSMQRVPVDILIGADGPSSMVAKTNGLFTRKGRDFLIGLQYIIRPKEGKDIFRHDEVELDLGVTDDFFGWVVPIGNGDYRVGVAAKKNTRSFLKKYLNRLRKRGLEFDRPSEVIGGVIPLYKNGLCISKDKVFLVGDAAAHIKNTSGGGIIMGLKAATSLMQSIHTDADYQDMVKRTIGKDLRYAYLIRKMLGNMDDDDKDDLVNIFRKKKNSALLSKIGDMDYPSRFAFRLLLSEPKLLKFILKML